MSTVFASPIAGLLPGCEFVRIGQADPTEFEQVGDRIYKGERGMSQVVVKPAAGYRFLFDILNNCYAPVRDLPAKKSFVIRFEAEDEWGLKRLYQIGQVLGVVSITEEEASAPVVPIPDAPAPAA
jgi:hypothetical protein